MESLPMRQASIMPIALKSCLRCASICLANGGDARLASGAAQTHSLKSELVKIEREVEQFLDRIADTEVPSIISAYEHRIRKLEARKLEVAEKIANCGRPLRSFDETLRTAMGFLAKSLESMELRTA